MCPKHQLLSETWSLVLELTCFSFVLHYYKDSIEGGKGKVDEYLSRVGFRTVMQCVCFEEGDGGRVVGESIGKVGSIVSFVGRFVVPIILIHIVSDY